MGTCKSTCNAPSSEDPHLGFEPKLDTQNAYFGPLVVELQAIYNAPLVPVKKFLGLGPEGVVPCCQVSVTYHDSAGNLKANEYHWPEAAKTHNPRWMQAAVLGADRALNDKLRFTLRSAYRIDESGDSGGTVLGHAELLLDDNFDILKSVSINIDLVPECQRINRATARSVDVNANNEGTSPKNWTANEIKSGNNFPECEMLISFFPAPPEKKTIILVRHGESRWNEGQENVLASHQLVRTVDHPLSDTGYMQAQNLASDIAEVVRRDNSAHSFGERKLLEAELIFASPMTRALQTACFGLATHPTMQRNGLKVLSSAREYKNTVASLDCVGRSLGSEIIDRAIVESETLTVQSRSAFDTHPIFGWEDMQESSSSSVKKETLDLAGKDVSSTPRRRIKRLVDLHDAADAATEWWTPPLESDSGKSFDDRLEGFMSQIHLRPETVIIVVGHSYFFRALCDRFTHPECLQQKVAKGITLADLGDSKISNCGVVALSMDFNNIHMKPIVGGELLFGTKVSKQKRGPLLGVINRSGEAVGGANARKKLDFNSWTLGPSGVSSLADKESKDSPPPPPRPLGSPPMAR